jgi:hypothetical protein
VPLAADRRLDRRRDPPSTIRQLRRHTFSGMNETQTLAVQALCELLDNPDRNDWDELVAGVKARLARPQRKQVPVRIFARPDRGSAQPARSRLTDILNVDRTAAAAAEIATLRQKLAAAEPRIRENTDRGQKPIKGGAGPRMVDGHLADEVRYILRRAAEHDGRVVTIGQLVLFSTETGDALLLDPSDQLAARLAREVTHLHGR